MTKDDFVKAIMEASKKDVTKAQVESMLTAMGDVVKKNVLDKGESISIYGLGTFKQKQSAEKLARNPQTGAPVTVPARTKVGFKPTPALVK